MKTTLVVGATGQIGGELARLLVAAGEDVRGLTRDPARAPVGTGITFVKGDLERPQTLGDAFLGVEQAFFVGPASPGLGAIAGGFFDAAKAAGVRRIVAVSSGTIVIEPPAAIGLWHRAMEERLAATALQATLLRPNAFATNTLRWAGTIRAQSTVFHPHGDAKTAPIDPRDIAAVACAALTSGGHEGKTYVLTGSQVLTAREQVEKIGAALGKTIRFVDVPEDGARKGMIGSGMPDFMADGILELIRAAARGNGFNTTTVRDITGRDARTFDEWLRDNVDAFR